MLRNLLAKLLGDTNERELKRARPLVTKINALEEEYQKLSDAELQAKTAEFRARLAAGETLDDLLPEAYAVVKNACRRLVGTSWEVRGHAETWQIVPYDVQLLGAIFLHRGKIAEMKTGEGKTLVCTLPLYLNALTGQGVHLVTANSYLATRDAEWMGGLLKYLGLTVGVVTHEIMGAARREAYAADVTYGTNTEFGFDYLRDNMVRDAAERVQRPLSFAIVDEVDSILIDEARTPLIISAPGESGVEKYSKYSQLIPQLTRDADFELDEKGKTATLTEAGIAKMEKLLGLENIYTEAGFSEVHHIEQALKAHAVFRRDKDYVVKDGEILIVDEFTGRLMPGRRYSDGLHQALEAKEKVEVRRESQTLATITLQNYFRLYSKLGGMTGTALTEAEEFAKIYNLEVVQIPTHREVARLDLPDAVYKNEAGKLTAIVGKIRELHAKGQPVLVGTITIEKSEQLGGLLARAGIPHTVLNAKQHEKEAEIVADAGQRGAVTIATNMAGRGTDIKLGEGVAELGGLFILGTERHESRRIDNQLRGRAGRQGDPGGSQFFISMEDSLMRLFGGERLQRMMEMLQVPDDLPIENAMISRSIEGAQKKVEAHNFAIRKHLVDFDDVMNAHRTIIYSRRGKILEHADIASEIQKMIGEVAESFVAQHIAGRDGADWDFAGLIKDLQRLAPSAELTETQLEKLETEKEVAHFARGYLENAYHARAAALPEIGMLRHAERQIYLSTLDRLWMEHLENMRYLREKVSLRGFAQRDPLLEYKAEAYELFESLLGNIRSNTVQALFHLEIHAAVPRPAAELTPVATQQTNAAEVEDILTGNREFTPEQQQKMSAIAQQLLRANPTVAALGKSGVATVRADDTPAVKVASADHPTVIRVEDAPTKVTTDRNAPCSCGSGKKYKKCCGA